MITKRTNTNDYKAVAVPTNCWIVFVCVWCIVLNYMYLFICTRSWSYMFIHVVAASTFDKFLFVRHICSLRKWSLNLDKALRCTSSNKNISSPSPEARCISAHIIFYTALNCFQNLNTEHYRLGTVTKCLDLKPSYVEK